jgi:exodeoxyribonuclease V alpha subunit
MTAVRQQIIKLKGELTSWRPFKEGWGIGQLRTDRAELVPLTGKLIGARIGDTLDLVGAWDEHPRYGRQFKVRECTVARPESADGIIAWLASTLPDIGEGRARALVERYGDQLWHVIETAHEALAAVDGITPKRAEAIYEAYMKHRADRDNMIRLRGWGLTDTQIARCIEVWGHVSDVVEHVHANPYQLSQHVHGFGFVRADKVATKAGIAHDAPERLQAGVEHEISEAASAGHCYVSGAALQKMAAKLLDVDATKIPKAILAAASSGRVVRNGWRIYARQLDAAERACAESIGRLLAGAA